MELNTFSEVNNKDADQTAQMGRLVSTFVVNIYYKIGLSNDEAHFIFTITVIFRQIGFTKQCKLSQTAPRNSLIRIYTIYNSISSFYTPHYCSKQPCSNFQDQHDDKLVSAKYVVFSFCLLQNTAPGSEVKDIFSMLNSTKHEISFAHKN